MRFSSFLTTVALALSLPLLGVPLAAKRAPAFPQTPSGDQFPNKSIVVYVTDFDIGATDAPGLVRTGPNRKAVSVNAIPADPAATAAPASGAVATSVSTPATAANAADAPTADGDKSVTRPETQAADAQQPDAPKSEAPQDTSPRAQAARLVELTSTTLVKALQKAGYSVRRLRNPATAPDDGVVIHGVFAQADPSAGLRRVVLGGVVTDPKMLLFIGIGNLAKPEQVLYQVAGPQPAGNVGPVISVSAYAPISRYALDREPSEEELKQTAELISSDLTRLLNANPLALGQ